MYKISKLSNNNIYGCIKFYNFKLDCIKNRGYFIIMCGRNSIFSPQNKIKKELKVDVWKDEKDYQPAYNVAPTQNSLVLVDNNKRIIHSMRWGFGFDSNRRPIFNARAETLNTKPTFKDLINKNRCIVISDGFYEWKRQDNHKIPYFIFHEQGKILPMAGLCKWDMNQKGEKKLVFTIITKEARPSLQHIHHREPVILSNQSMDRWIDVLNYDNDPQPLLYDNLNDIKSHQVSSFVNKTSNNNQECIAKVN